MTTTTGDPSTLKTPASLSGGDLVNRLLAATPPYLYNVPLTPNSFFFSEMLRSFVQAKAETSPIEPVPSTPRRRKRSWKDTRDRPLELTTKERHHHHHHHHQSPLSHQQQGEKYFHSPQHYEPQQQQQHHHHHLPQQSQVQDSHLDSQNQKTLEVYDMESKNLVLEQKSQDFGIELLKSVDENRSKFKPSKNYFADRIPNLQESIFLSETSQKGIKPEDSERNCTFSEKDNLEERCPKTTGSSELSFLATEREQKSKLDFNARNFLPTLPAVRGGDEQSTVAAKGFTLPTGNVPNPEFLPNPLWYPPYPMPQSYPGIDPLHFFIDLRVSGHIWDRKLNERHLPFKSKHSSAFSVPQAKEYNNRPLNLTRDEASSRSCEANHQGTHYILKHITKTYKDIKEAEKDSRTEITEVTIEEDSPPMSEELESSKKEETSNSTSNQEEEKKDLRALIGLELVVDYVKEPKGESSSSECSPQITE